MMRGRYLLALAACVLALSACGATTSAPSGPTTVAVAGAIEVSGAWVRAAAPMGEMDGMGGSGMEMPTAAAAAPMAVNSAAYMTIRNASDTPDQLLQVTSDLAAAAELHTVVRDGAVMQMQPVEAIDVPANGQVVLEPGSFHVMLVGVTRDLTPGETVTLTLQFAQAGTLPVQLQVRQ